MAWKTCKNCGVQFQGNGKHYCTWACFCASVGSHKPDPDLLYRLVWTMPTRVLGTRYRVSDKAVEKWCRKAGVLKPPRGYWAKVQAGKIVRVNLMTVPWPCSTCRHMVARSFPPSQLIECWAGQSITPGDCKAWEPKPEEADEHT